MNLNERVSQILSDVPGMETKDTEVEEKNVAQDEKECPSKEALQKDPSHWEFYFEHEHLSIMKEVFLLPCFYFLNVFLDFSLNISCRGNHLEKLTQYWRKRLSRIWKEYKEKRRFRLQFIEKSLTLFSQDGDIL